jgi:hypothetical protein
MRQRKCISHRMYFYERVAVPSLPPTIRAITSGGIVLDLLFCFRLVDQIHND